MQLLRVLHFQQFNVWRLILTTTWYSAIGAIVGCLRMVIGYYADRFPVAGNNSVYCFRTATRSCHSTGLVTLRKLGKFLSNTATIFLEGTGVKYANFPVGNLLSASYICLEDCFQTKGVIQSFPPAFRALPPVRLDFMIFLFFLFLNTSLCISL